MRFVQQSQSYMFSCNKKQNRIEPDLPDCPTDNKTLLNKYPSDSNLTWSKETIMTETNDMYEMLSNHARDTVEGRHDIFQKSTVMCQ